MTFPRGPGQEEMEGWPAEAGQVTVCVEDRGWSLRLASVWRDFLEEENQNLVPGGEEREACPGDAPL